jgi:hypothetical protein
VHALADKTIVVDINTDADLTDGNAKGCVARTLATLFGGFHGWKRRRTPCREAE